MMFPWILFLTISVRFNVPVIAFPSASASHENLSNAEILVLKSIVEKVKENLIILSSTNILAKIQSKGNITKPFAVFDKDNVTKDLFRVNIELFKRKGIINYYLIIPDIDDDDDEVKALMKNIRWFDWLSYIIVLYRTNVDVESYLGARVYDVMIIKPSIDTDSYFLYEVCRLCKKGRNKINLINKWNLTTGFTHEVKFLKSFKNNFYGRRVKMGLDIRRSFSIRGRDAKGRPIYGGVKWYRYKRIGDVLNLKWRFVDARDIRLYYIQMIKGKFNVIGGSRPSDHRVTSLFDFSAYEFSYSYVIISVKPPKGVQWYAFSQPFPLLLWVCIIATIPIVGTGLYFLKYLQKKSCKIDTCHLSPGDCIWNIVKITCWDTAFIKNPLASECLLVSSYLLANTVIVNGYIGVLCSFMTAPTYLHPPIESIQDLEESGKQ